ncbi:isopentenyldiphosphate isomerase [Kordia periserrulae]|uniref:Isopentenyldiphosphate isomerase n=1 Tax=Kordia periserrulae TaxID=701523 RepID=A0A2T6BZ70_9FLAO|nr:NUDIX domain-containing protein [Kordia periserrulae]PTX61361.1 isopentenyldiphosphate isomerase [Kordia periserrulae]
MELIDILDEHGNPTGEILPKREVHRYGHFHASTHLWLYTKTGKIVLQLRAATKPNFPNRWDVSVAGHISSGETAKETAIREAEEELGIKVQSAKLQHIGRFRIDYQHAEDYRDREFITIFASEIPDAPLIVTLQEEEVADVTLIPLAQVEAELTDTKLAQKYVPFNKAYAKEVFEKLHSLFD